MYLFRVFPRAFLGGVTVPLAVRLRVFAQPPQTMVFGELRLIYIPPQRNTIILFRWHILSHMVSRVFLASAPL
jgi:hypothetical protein